MYATGWLSLSVLLLCLWVNTPEAEAWSGHVCAREERYHYRQHLCIFKWYRRCVRWGNPWRIGYRRVENCCKGWTHNGDKNCDIRTAAVP